MSVFASVIIPTLNEEKHIRKCLESISKQTFPRGEYEIIVADGHSKDGTVRIAKRFADRIVFEDKHIIAAGRQSGAKAARGKILVFSDGDAVVEENWLEELLEPFKDGGVVCSFGTVMPMEKGWFKEFSCGLFSLYLFLTNLVGLPSGAGSSLAIRKNAFVNAGGFDTSLVTAEDVELQRRVKKFGKMVFAPKAVVRVSFRRIEKWGYLKFFLFHTANFFSVHFLGRPADDYERVR